MSRDRRKLQAVPAAVLPADEQALLVAYRVMDDQERVLILRVAISSGVRHPAPAQRGPRLLGMPAASLSLLKDFCSISESAQNDVCRMVAAIAEDEASRPERQPLRLVTGGRS